MKLDKTERKILLQKLNNIRYDNKRLKDELSYIREDMKENPLHPGSFESSKNLTQETKDKLSKILLRLYDKIFETKLEITFNKDKIKTIENILIANEF